jgi:excinuclease ABC subunit C
LLYQIKRCSAPCVGKITQQDYQEDVDDVTAFLKGNAPQLITGLEQRMMAHSDRLEFEQAAVLRNRITALSKVFHQQSLVVPGDQDVDILAVAVRGGRACVNLAMVRGGRHLGDRAYFPSHIESAIALEPEPESEFETLPRSTKDAPVEITPTPAANPNPDQNVDVNTVTNSVSGIDTDTNININTPVNSQTFSPEQQILEAFIVQHYLNVPVPPILILGSPVERKLIAALSEQVAVRITAVFAPHQQRRLWLEMAQKNADLQLTRILAEQGSQKARVRALVEALDLPMTTDDELDNLLIECFDVSHTGGEATQASCVVFTHHAMQSREYRRYNIDGVTSASSSKKTVQIVQTLSKSDEPPPIAPGDDYAAMRQALMRRYSKVVEAIKLRDTKTIGITEIETKEPVTLPQVCGFGKKQQFDNQETNNQEKKDQAQVQIQDQKSNKIKTKSKTASKNQNKESLSSTTARLPDLVLIDGGVGQVAVASEVFKTLGLPLSSIVGVKKGQGRKVGLEELVFADGREKIYLGQDSAALMLVAQIRDEAHRFAITGMRAKRAKTRMGSQLQDIPGIGPKRRARLLQRFGGIRGVASASIEDIASVEGIARDLAEDIYRALH